MKFPIKDFFIKCGQIRSFHCRKFSPTQISGTPGARFGRSSRPEVFFKEAVLKILENSQENTCAKASFLIKVTDLGQCKNEVVQQW